MILDGITSGFLNLIIQMINWIPDAQACDLTGLTGAITYFNVILGLTSYWFPWETVWVMVRIILMYVGITIIVQTIKMIK